ncbi:hypothetical protein D3C71_1624650 [compost metagenome]
MAARNADRIAKAKAVELVNILRALHIIHFIDSENDRLARTEQNLRNLFVRIRQPALRFTHEHDEIGFLDRKLGLHPD